MSRTDPRRIERVLDLQRWADAERARGRRIALVPTMGGLHEGHLSLVRLARAMADRVVVSIFVNPTQFGPGEDFDRYPRDLERDVGELGRCGVHVVFAPSVEEMYPQGGSTWVEVEGLADGMCGRFRPGHFRGVATVVARLLAGSKPHVAVFGEKDYQQLQVVRRMVRDLRLDVEIVGGPTAREGDGLALSSRNAYLGRAARAQALALYAGLREARDLALAGERSRDRLVGVVRARLEKEPLIDVQYVELGDAETLEPQSRLEGRSVLAVAALVDGTRLIDNLVLEGS
ncbi:MAG: pantoate--beta-alanine ligase [Myxococcota bacterium]